MADDAVVLKASLDKRGKTVGSWTKRNVVLRKTELEYTHRFPWTNAVVALSDIINVTERFVRTRSVHWSSNGNPLCNAESDDYVCVCVVCPLLDFNSLGPTKMDFASSFESTKTRR